jgi:RNA-directed DNA polymerase
MSVEQPQGGAYFQRTFNFEGQEEAPRPGQDSEDGNQPVRCEEPQSLTASAPARAWTVNLMEEVTDRDHLNRAYRRVLANKGAPGVDGLTVRELKTWIAGHKAQLIAWFKAQGLVNPLDWYVQLQH